MMKNYQHRFELRGYIWTGDYRPITLSGILDGSFTYIQIDVITGWFRREAIRRGIRIGELVDELNSQIPESKTGIEIRFDSTNRQQDDFRKPLSGVDYE